MSVAKPQTPDVCIVEDTTDVDLLPPGKCTPEEHRDLQNRAENACGSAKSCSGSDDIATLNRKIGCILLVLQHVKILIIDVLVVEMQGID